MFAGKSTELLKRILWSRNGRGQAVRVYKPAFDQRYSEIEIVTHEGLASNAEAIVDWTGKAKPFKPLARRCVPGRNPIFEAPNFQGDIVEITAQLLRAGVDVVAAGLDMDWRGAPFQFQRLCLQWPMRS